MNLFRDGERPPGTDPRPGRAVATRPVSLPGTSRAFSGRAAPTPRRSLTRSDIANMDDAALLDADEAIDRRRRGVGEGDDIRREVQARQDAKKKKAAAAKKPADPDALKALDAKATADADAKKALENEAEQARKKKKKKEAAAEAKKPKP